MVAQSATIIYIFWIPLLDGVVTIEGEFKTDDNEYLMRELPHGSFSRSLRLPALQAQAGLPAPVDAEKAEAKITDGVLTLRLPKAESARPKTIRVAAK